MPRFNVMLTITAPVSTSIEVNAPNARTAAAKAVQHVLESPDYRILDFDGNSIDILKDDVTVDEVEPA
jgi:hypothetical protein